MEVLIDKDEELTRHRSNGGESSSLRVLMSSLDHYGRAQSLISIAAELIRRGHSVTYATHKKFKSKLESLAIGPHASEVNIIEIPNSDGVNKSAADDLLKELTKPQNSDTLSIMRSLVDLLATEARVDAPFFLRILEEEDDGFDVIVNDLNGGGLTMAWELHERRNRGNVMPIVINFPILVQGELLRARHQGGYFPASNENVLYDLSFKQRLKNVVRRRFGFLVSWHVIGSRYRSKFADLFEEVCEGVCEIRERAKPLLVGTVPGFDVPHEVPQHHFYTGPMVDLSVLSKEAAEEDAHVQWALSSVRNDLCSSGVFFISLGTSVTLGDAEELNGLARAFVKAATSQQETATVCFLWSLKQTQQDMLFPEVKQDIVELKGRFKLAEFVSMRLFLRWAPVVGVLSQGGVASVSEPLYFGVPLVVVPFLFDQIDLASRVSAANAGIDIGGRPHNVTAIEQSIAVVISDPTYKQGAERMGKLFRRAGGVTRAADIIENVVEFGGETYMPLPYRQNAPWWVDSDVDVIVFLTTCGWSVVILATVVILRLFGLLKQMKRKKKQD